MSHPVIDMEREKAVCQAAQTIADKITSKDKKAQQA